MVAPEIGMPLRVPSKTESEIEREMERLGKSAHALHELVGMLGERLSRVSHPYPTSGDAKLAEAEPPVGSSLGGEVREVSRNLEQTARAIRMQLDVLAI
jgi:hypothetical protein